MITNPCYNSSCSEKYSTSERMCGYNYSFIIGKGPFVEWIAATRGELPISSKTDDYKCLFQKKTVPLKILDHCKCKWHPEIITVPLKCMAASTALKLQYALNRNTTLIHCKYAIHGCNCYSEINTVSIQGWMAATNSVK